MLAATLLVGCSIDGRQYTKDLSDLIGRSDRILVTEHSSPGDFPPIHGKSLKEVVYQRIVLTDEQRARFRSGVEALPPKLQDAFPACVFESHHRIDFFASGKQLGSVEVCFECGQVEWAGSHAKPPAALFESLVQLIESLGLQPERNWRALARGGQT